VTEAGEPRPGAATIVSGEATTSSWEEYCGGPSIFDVCPAGLKPFFTAAVRCCRPWTMITFSHIIPVRRSASFMS
jgi:hypothetical protein